MPEAPALARRWLAERVGPDLDGPQLADAKLLVTELVTNALVHGHGTIEVHGELDENRLRVEVVDQGKGFEWIVRERQFELGEWGIHLVDAIASRWGIHQDSSHVWFELHPRPRPGPAEEAAS